MVDKFLVTVSGIGLIALIWWFFFSKKYSFAESSYARGSTPERQETIEVVVDGGYKPSVIKIKKGVVATLKVKRTDSNSCLEEIVLPDFKIKKYLPLNKEVKIEFTPTKKGEFGFHCGMNMYHGKIIIE